MQRVRGLKGPCLPGPDEVSTGGQNDYFSFWPCLPLAAWTQFVARTQYHKKVRLCRKSKQNSDQVPIVSEFITCVVHVNTRS